MFKINKWITKNEEIKLTVEDKLTALQKSQQMRTSVSLLKAAFDDCELNSHIRFAYKIDGVVYEITFLPIKHFINHE